MATEITMPKLSDTMEEGVLISWKKSVGERVERGDIIAEVETDKATMELEAFASGVLMEIRAKAGDVVPVGTVIGIIGAETEKLTSGKVAAVPVKDVKEEKPEKQPSISVPENEKPREEPESASDSGYDEKIVQTSKIAADEKGGGGVEKASPMVRRMARDGGVELSQVTGTGPEGQDSQGGP